MSHDIVSRIAALFAEHSGFSARAARTEHVRDAITRFMLRHGLADPAAALAHLGDGDAALDELVADLVSNETYFYRDPEQLEAIRTRVLPALVGSRSAEHVLRVWSAGCATGEEPYSLAMLLEDEGLAQRTEILATDISRPSLARAAHGAYGSWSLRALSAMQRARWFTPRGGEHLLLERIRRRVSFGHLNLAQEPFPSLATRTQGLDLIVCRNVLIYFSRETRARVARRLVASLALGGWLVLGASDPLLDRDEHVEMVTTTAGALYRRCGRRSPARAPVVFAVSALGTQPPASSSMPPPPPAPTTPTTLNAARAALDAGDYPLAVRLAGSLHDDAAASAVHIRALANLEGPDRAADACAEALRRHPLSAELRELHAAALVGAGRSEDAITALRRVLYLEPSCTLAHLLLASVLRTRGDALGSARALRNALKLGPVPADLTPASR